MKKLAYAILALALLVFAVGPALAAWPTTPLTTYVSGTTPYIKAFDLNSIQAAINRAFLGTYSYKAIQIDGIGGANSAPPTGSLIVSRTTSGTAPTTSTLQGELTKGLVPQCWGQLSSAGSLQRGVNILSAARTGAGTYKVVCYSVPSDLVNTAVVGNTLNVSGGRTVNIATQDDGGGHLQVNIGIINNAGTFVDENVQFVAYAE